MSRRTAAQWDAILRFCGMSALMVDRWAPVFSHTINDHSFSQDDDDLADFLPNILHESAMLARMEESLNYAASSLQRVFGAHRITAEQAQRYGRIDGVQAADQPAIANIVYGGAWGRANLGNIAPGDGWTYRGRSPIQITGRANYMRVGDLMGQNLVGLPDLLSQPHFALEACIAWWEDRIPDSILGETTTIRNRVNGGTLGLAEVQRLTDRVRMALANNS